MLTVIGLASPAAGAPVQDVEVMVVGTWHFDNPGEDLANIQAEDVLTPRRQAELAEVAQSIARFRPTKIAVERVSSAPDLLDPNYITFRTTDLAVKRDERVQIGYRIAQMLGHQRVYAIDEQPTGGEPSYFPFDTVTSYARANGQGQQLQSFLDAAAHETSAFGSRQREWSISNLLVAANDKNAFMSSIRSYYDVLGIGDTEEQPGAVLNAMWYMRNAKIFGKLMTIAEPGDRVLVIYGAGHNYWLRHFARETRGYRSVDPLVYLKPVTPVRKRKLNR